MTRDEIAVAGGVTLSVVRRDGRPDATPFLLVHGLASNARLWDGVAEELHRRGHASVAVDQRGHGRSQNVDDGFDFATLAQDLRSVVAQSFDAAPVIAGQSWGGNVVLEMADRYPHLAAGLGLVDGGFLTLSESFPRWSDAAIELAPPQLEGLPAPDLERRMRTRLKGWPESGIQGQLANFEFRSDGTVRPYLSRQHHMTILRELWQHHPDDIASRIEAPTLVISVDGHSDKRDRVESFARSLKRGRVVWVDGHHDVHAQQPEFVADLLIQLATEQS